MTAPTTPADPLLGTCIAGKYDVVRLLGEGGFGAVYVAIQRPVGREVALKTIRTQHAGNTELRQRFYREARVVASLTNEATVTLFDYGETEDGLLYMVLELVRGRPLSVVLREQRPVPPERAARLMLPVLAALSEAHAAGLVHRDLKPDNVMVLTDTFGQEKVKVLDFGIAKVLESDVDSLNTRTGMVLGTPAYMSPEQAFGRGVGPPSDLYAVGVMLYEMLAGVLPFRAPSAFEILTQHTTVPVPPLPSERDVPPALAALVYRTLAKTPESRWPDARAMAMALDAASGGRPSLSGHGPPPGDETLPLGPTEALPSAPQSLP